MLQQSVEDLVFAPPAVLGFNPPTVRVPLSAILEGRKASGTAPITHLGQFPAAAISFEVRVAAFSLGAAVNATLTAPRWRIGTALRASSPPFRARLRRSGPVASPTELFLILAALVTMYIVLGVLYESFIHPLTILSTLPSAGVGGLLALMMAGRDLDLTYRDHRGKYS